MRNLVVRTVVSYRFSVCVLSALGICGVSSAEAQTFTWNNVTGNWNTAANWTGGVVPTSGTTNTLVFGSGASGYTSTFNLTSPFQMNSLQLQANTGISNKITSATLTNILQLSGTNPLLSMSGGGTFTIETDVTIGAGGTIDVGTGGTLILGNSSTGGSALRGVSNSVLTKTGAGTLVYQSLASVSQFNINEGTVTTNVNQDFFASAAIVNVGAAGILDFGGFGEGFGQLIGSGNVFGGFDVSSTASQTFSGVIQDRQGAAANVSKGSTGTWTLAGANLFTGSLEVDGGTVRMADTGSLATTAINVLDAAFTLDNGTANNLQRMNDAAVLLLRDGGQFNFLGNASATSSETIGTLDLGPRTNIVTLTPGAGQTAALTFGKITRSLYGTILFRGANLGAAAGAGVSQAFITTPTLIGGVGAPGSKNLAIIPYALGDLSPTGTGTSFVTYDPTNGIRLLDVLTEFSEYSAAATGDNVRMLASTSAAGKAINSLLLDASSGAIAFSGSGFLEVTSGSMLVLGTNGVSFSGFSGVTANGAEWVVNTLTAGSSVDFAMPISGGGLTKVGAGSLSITAANNLVGGVRVFGGTLIIGGDSSLGNASDLLQLSNATLKLASNWTASRLITLNVGATSNTSTSSLDTAGFDALLTGVLSGVSKGFTKAGEGTLTLYGTNTFGSLMTFSGGTTVIVDSRGLGATGNSLAFNSGAKLRLDGPITNAMAVALGAGGGEINTHGFNATFSGVFSSTGPLTKSGLGTLTLTGANTASGGIVIAGGTLSVGVLANLGSAANVLTFQNGGTLLTTAGITTTRNVTLGFGGGAVDNGGFNSTFSGIFSGTGDLTTRGTGTLTLSGVNTFNGTATVNDGVLALAAGGRAASAASFRAQNGGTIWLDNTATNNGNRIDDGVVISLLDRGSFLFSGNASVAASETIGALSATAGYGTVTIAAGAGGATTVTAGSIQRSGRATLLFRGANLGNAPAAGVARFLVTSPADLFGSGTTPGTTNLQILPYAVGDMSAIGVGNSLVTVDASAGVRPLNLTTEYATYDLSGADGNVRITATPVAPLPGKTIQALVIDNVGPAYSVAGDGTGVLNVAGGTMLFSGTGGITLSGFTSLDFGAQEGYFHVTNTSSAGVTISLPVTGFVGITKSGYGKLTLGGNNTFVGGIRINAGTLVISNENNLGNAFNTLTFAGGTLQLAGPATITGRQIELLGSGAFDTNGFDLALGLDVFVFGDGALTKAGVGTLTLNTAVGATQGVNVLGGTLRLGLDNAIGYGPLNINGGTLDLQSSFASVTTLVLQSGSILGTGRLNADAFDLRAGTIDAVLEGSGALVKSGAGTVTLTNSNTYTGGTAVTAGTLVIGPNSLGVATAPVSLFGGALQVNSSFSINRIVVIGAGSLDTAAFNVTLGGLLTGSGALTKIGSGTLTISGTSNQYAGSTVINEGTLQISQESNLGAGTTITINNDAVFKPTANMLFTTHKFVIGANGGTIDTNGFNLQIDAGASLANSGTFTKIGAGVLTIESQSGAGLVQILEGTFRSRTAGSGNFLSGDLFIAAGALVDLNDNGEAFGALNGAGNVYLGVLPGTGLGPGSTTAMNYSGVISGAGSFSLGDSGGSMLLGGNNTYTGPTSVVAGFTLTLGIDDALPTQTVLTLNGIMQMNGHNQSIGSLATSTTPVTASIVLGPASTVQLTIGNSGTASTTFAGIVSGPGSIRKVGTSKQVFSGANTFTGGLDIDAGTVEYGASNVFANTLPIRINGGTLSMLTRSDTVGPVTLNSGSITGTTGVLTSSSYSLVSGTVGAILGGSGTLTKSGTGTVTLTRLNTFAGATSITGGRLDIATGAALIGTGGITVGTAGHLNVVGGVTGTATSTTTINGGLTGTGSIAGDVALKSTGVIAPGDGTPNNGNGVGTLTIAGTGVAMAIDPSASFYFDFHNAAGATAGTDWDFVKLTAGTLRIDATAANPIKLYLSTDDTAFNPNPTVPYEWRFLQTTGVTLSGSDPLTSLFQIDDSAVFGSGGIFAGQRPVGGSFYVTQHANDLYIGYAAVPEPSSLVLCGLAGLGLAWYRRRRKKQIDVQAAIVAITA